MSRTERRFEQVFSQDNSREVGTVRPKGGTWRCYTKDYGYCGTERTRERAMERVRRAYEASHDAAGTYNGLREMTVEVSTAEGTRIRLISALQVPSES